VKRSLAGLFAVLCATGVLSAVQMTLDPRAISEAIAIGQSRVDVNRARFHAPYRTSVAKAPVDSIEVVTPFRLVAMHAESRARAGDRSFGQRQAFAILSVSPAELEVWVELTFHPLNTYVGVPPYEVALIDTNGVRTPPRTIQHVPRHGPRVDGEPLLGLPGAGGIALPGGSEPMTGGSVTAQFDGRPLNATGVYQVVVVEGRTELARVSVDFAKLR
jgi:hypothetical protein